jgi:hypothetical protein
MIITFHYWQSVLAKTFTGKEIKRMPQSHLEAHCLERMWEKVFWRTTSSSQQPCAMEALCGRPMFLTESGGYVCMYYFLQLIRDFHGNLLEIIKSKTYIIDYISLS